MHRDHLPGRAGGPRSPGKAGRSKSPVYYQVFISNIIHEIITMPNELCITGTMSLLVRSSGLFSAAFEWNGDRPALLEET
jgi:hypothetical protein